MVGGNSNVIAGPKGSVELIGNKVILGTNVIGKRIKIIRDIVEITYSEALRAVKIIAGPPGTSTGGFRVVSWKEVE